jgi:hypothetical protein
MRIVSKIVPLEWQRYETLGDYFDNGDTLHFRITDTGNDEYNKLILIHEIVEEMLTRNRGISEKNILEYDLKFEESGKDGEPGEQDDCPYKKEHRFAELIERMICHEIGIDWDKYNKDLNEVIDGKA